MVPNILQCTRQHSTIKTYPAIKPKMSAVHRLRLCFRDKLTYGFCLPQTALSGKQEIILTHI